MMIRALLLALLFAAPAAAQRTHVTVEATVGNYAAFINLDNGTMHFLVEARNATTGELIAQKFAVASVYLGGMRGVVLARVPPGGIVWLAATPMVPMRYWYTSARSPSTGKSSRLRYRVPATSGRRA